MTLKLGKYLSFWFFSMGLSPSIRTAKKDGNIFLCGPWLDQAFGGRSSGVRKGGEAGKSNRCEAGYV